MSDGSNKPPKTLAEFQALLLQAQKLPGLQNQQNLSNAQNPQNLEIIITHPFNGETISKAVREAILGNKEKIIFVPDPQALDPNARSDLLTALLDHLLTEDQLKISNIVLDLERLIKATDPSPSKVQLNNYNLIQNQIANNQRAYNKKVLAENALPTPQKPKRPKKRDRGNALKNLSQQVNVNQQMQAQLQEEQQQEEQEAQQEEQQLQQEQQRQVNIAALKERMRSNKSGNKKRPPKHQVLIHEFVTKDPSGMHVAINLNNPAQKKLELLWGMITPRGETAPDAKNKPKIVSISEEVAAMLEANPDFFKSGLSLDYLPPGFSLYPAKDNENELFLDFDQFQYAQDIAALSAGNNPNILYPSIEQVRGLNITWKGDHRQFNGLKKSEFDLVSNSSNQLIPPLSHHNESISAQEKLNLFIALLKAEDPNFMTLGKEKEIRESLYFKRDFVFVTEPIANNIADDNGVRTGNFYVYPNGNYAFRVGDLVLRGNLNIDITPTEIKDLNWKKEISKQILVKHKIETALDFNFHLDKLAPIVNKYGAQGADVIIKNIISLENKFGLFDSRLFIDTYINNPRMPYDSILNNERLEALSKVMEFNKTEFKLFSNLSAEDSPPKPRSNEFPSVLNLKKQVNNFNIFKNKLLALGISDLQPLLDNYPNIEGQNMAVVMQRIITILEHSIDPIKQFKHLRGLDLSPYKAYHAITKEGYHFVTLEMGFNSLEYVKKQKSFNEIIHKRKNQNKVELVENSTPAELGAPENIIHLGNEEISDNLKYIEPTEHVPGFQLQSSLSDFIYIQDLNDSKQPTILFYQSLFLRIVGKSNNADQYSGYKKIIDHFISSYTNLTSQDATLALALTAFCTIHDKASNVNPEAYDIIFEKIKILHLSGLLYSTESILTYLHLADNSNVKRPNHEQMIALIDFHYQLGELHELNSLDSFEPTKIEYLKVIEKFGNVYFEVIHNNYISRSRENLPQSAKNIVEIAKILSEIEHLENPNNIFKVLSYCNYQEKDKEQIAKEIKPIINKLVQYDQTKINFALDILSSLKFRSKDSPRPSLENFNSLLEKINDMDEVNENSVFEIIKTSEGFRYCVIPTQKAREYSSAGLIEQIKENRQLIEEHLPNIGLSWRPEYEENIQQLINDIIQKADEGGMNAIAINFLSKKIFKHFKETAKSNIRSNISEKFTPTVDGKSVETIARERIESDHIIHFLETQYFDSLKSPSGIKELNSALGKVEAYMPVANTFLEELSYVKM